MAQGISIELLQQCMEWNAEAVERCKVLYAGEAQAEQACHLFCSLGGEYDSAPGCLLQQVLLPPACASWPPSPASSPRQTPAIAVWHMMKSELQVRLLTSGGHVPMQAAVLAQPPSRLVDCADATVAGCMCAGCAQWPG